MIITSYYCTKVQSSKCQGSHSLATRLYLSCIYLASYSRLCHFISIWMPRTRTESVCCTRNRVVLMSTVRLFINVGLKPFSVTDRRRTLWWGNVSNMANMPSGRMSTVNSWPLLQIPEDANVVIYAVLASLGASKFYLPKVVASELRKVNRLNFKWNTSAIVEVYIYIYMLVSDSVLWMKCKKSWNQ